MYKNGNWLSVTEIFYGGCSFCLVAKKCTVVYSQYNSTSFFKDIFNNVGALSLGFSKMYITEGLNQY